MAFYLTITAIIIFTCVICNKISGRLGIPTLLAFILLGMFFGSDGIVKIHFDDYKLTEQICSIALIFIMFYGGFGTNLHEAKPVAKRAVILSSFGTIATAGIVGLFCHFILGIKILESFLIGSVISSTDAASVFSILRSKHLNLKDGTASLLEIESGSNDPFSYMLTVVILSVMNGNVSAGGVITILVLQLFLGITSGIAIALITRVFLRKFHFSYSGFETVFIFGVAVFAYSIPSMLGGNGYLSTYITGIILGNSKINNKHVLVNFFDGTTGLMQMVLFFSLGLLSFPSQLPAIIPNAVAVALFLTFIARPFVVFCIMAPLKMGFRQQMLISWAGMRGAASIVFAIMATINPATTDNDIFHITFFIVLFSILIQGSLIPKVAKTLDMTDENIDVMKTFNDYIDEVPVQFIRFTLPPKHPWANCEIKRILLPPESILVLIVRNNEKIVPNGNTVLMPDDEIVLIGRASGEVKGVNLFEKELTQNDEWTNKKVSDINSGDHLIIMIRRGGNVIIPKGKTVLKEHDILVINEAI